MENKSALLVSGTLHSTFEAYMQGAGMGLWSYNVKLKIWISNRELTAGERTTASNLSNRTSLIVFPVDRLVNSLA